MKKVTFKLLQSATARLRERSQINYQCFKETDHYFVAISYEHEKLGDVIVRGTVRECYISVKAIISACFWRHGLGEDPGKTRAALKNLVKAAENIPQPATHAGLELADALAHARTALSYHAQEQPADTMTEKIEKVQAIFREGAQYGSETACGFSTTDSGKTVINYRNTNIVLCPSLIEAIDKVIELHHQ